ncbi:D-tyrosyl-tRNA(Tyr) deacylase [Psychroflexus gondwanensis]|jgi:D-tyrosyl-tRNA(Tyr) deacylase|uniref:D-aminoacyl-tRNA deacylase n=1 Tax=Psychroflexus gondwanensis TaxID=251 RepID=UPI0011BF373C|nr:D-aminoacyl-tRNA deacylase [Psychroflexus gondwanensis]TXE20825.1 D-tyrosyl-tRNA(Tyr) deacylase [Psychroflexus gondwanensis]
MKIVVQRVKEASVEIGNEISGTINTGLLIFLGIENEDGQEDINWLVKKIINLRVFPDDEDKMNLSLKDIEGELLVVSQFTLHASLKKGNRPSFTKSAKPELAKKLYDDFLETLQNETITKIQTGRFGANMQVSLINDGPLTFILDSKVKL